MTEVRSHTGFYCSTSGTYFSSKDSLAEHYKSDFHRYNLKRKVAGLPPVTKEWFETRKAQLASASPAQAAQKVWLDPLTSKKFMSENTYLVYTRSKKYQDLVRKSGQEAPAPVIMIKKEAEEERQNNAAASAGPARPAGFKVKAPPGGLPGNVYTNNNNMMHSDAGKLNKEDEEADSDSDWETASEVGWCTANAALMPGS